MMKIDVLFFPPPEKATLFTLFMMLISDPVVRLRGSCMQHRSDSRFRHGFRVMLYSVLRFGCTDVKTEYQMGKVQNRSNASV